MFHVYLNKFENVVTHLFLVIFGNNRFPWVSLILRNTQSPRKQFLNFIFWFETVSEDGYSDFKRLKCCLKRNVRNISRTIPLKVMKFFSWNLLYIVHK